jgi:ethanolamine permease
VISGDYFGWNFGLEAGGFWGLAIATLVMAAMYICMVFSIAELSAALPHAGGFYSFVRSAFGPTGGFICGITDTIEYVITPAVIVVGIGGYLNELAGGIFGESPQSFAGWTWLWWLLSYAVFIYINIRGVEISLKVGLVITLLALVVLVIFYVGALWTGAFDSRLLFNVEPTPGNSADWLPKGTFGIFAALPFAIWFYLAIEQLPLAAEDAHNTVKDMPKALILGMLTLLILSGFTLVLNTGVGGGAAVLQHSGAPLVDGFGAVFAGRHAKVGLTLVALTGLTASFHAIVYAYGRVLFALSRAGYFPRWIFRTGRYRTPTTALILGGVIGFGCALVIDLTKDDAGQDSLVGASLLNMAVFGAVISYTMVLLSYIKLRVTRPDLDRPYRSPLGIPGAAVGVILSLIAMAATLAQDDLRPAVVGVAIFLVIGLLYYLAYSRHRLVAQAPEEEVALIAEAEDELAHR